MSGPLLLQLEELVDALNGAGLEFAAIGGLAVNTYGHVRATRDLDFLVDDEQRTVLLDTLVELGYEPIDVREDVASFVRGVQRVDVLFARRPLSRKFLREAQVANDLNLPVVSLEALIAFKVQAFNDDRRRLTDLADIIKLMELNHERLDHQAVREYFALFGQEGLLDDIVQRLRS